MTRTRIVLLILIALTSVPLIAAPPLRLGRDVVPVSESVTLKMDPRQDNYSGTAVIERDSSTLRKVARTPSIGCSPITTP